MPTKMSRIEQHGRLASVSSNVGVLMISVVTWMPSRPWNQLRHSSLIYSLSVGSRFRVVMIFSFKRCLKARNVAPIVIEAVVQFYTESGIDEQSEECNDFPLESIVTANGIFEA